MSSRWSAIDSDGDIVWQYHAFREDPIVKSLNESWSPCRFSMLPVFFCLCSHSDPLCSMVHKRMNVVL